MKWTLLCCVVCLATQAHASVNTRAPLPSRKTPKGRVVTRQSPKQAEVALSPEQEAIFEDFKNELYEAHKVVLAEEVKKNPTRGKQIIVEGRERFLRQVATLRRAYASGSIQILRKWTEPGISSGLPTGFGNGWGTATFFVALTPQSKFGGSDGSLGFGFGIGDPIEWVGVSVNIVAEGLYPDDLIKRSATDYFKFSLDNGGVNLHFSRNLPNLFSIAYGRAHVLSWGVEPEIRRNYKQSQYLVLSKILLRQGESPWFSRFAATLGVGDKGYLPFEHYISERKFMWPFAGVNVRIHDPVSLSLESQSSEFSIGVNIAPLSKYPLHLQISANNLLSRAGNSLELYFNGAYSINF